MDLFFTGKKVKIENSGELDKTYQSPIEAFLWTLPQPIFVFSCTLLMASALTTQWVDPGVLFGAIVLVRIPLLLVLERLVPRRRDWLLNSRDFAVDTFWVLTTYLIWYPFYDQYYDTPISKLFASLRDTLQFPYRLEADTTIGLVGAALIGVFAVEFIGYWAHRLQHRSFFLWRIHATHHHITKMSAARADRTHPLEFLGLYLGGAIALAFLGASDSVIAVVIIFRSCTGYVNHINLPLRSGLYGWLFTTTEMHNVHHSCLFAESNTNYGCSVILWDRVFGTFCGNANVERVGNGTGKQLTLLTQLAIPFRSNEALRNL